VANTTQSTNTPDFNLRSQYELSIANGVIDEREIDSLTHILKGTLEVTNTSLKANELKVLIQWLYDDLMNHRIKIAPALHDKLEAVKKEILGEMREGNCSAALHSFSSESIPVLALALFFTVPEWAALGLGVTTLAIVAFSGSRASDHHEKKFEHPFAFSRSFS
jgi:hypothetical protein